MNLIINFINTIFFNLKTFVEELADFFKGLQNITNLISDYSELMAGFLPNWITSLMVFLLFCGLMLFLIDLVLKIVQIITLGFGGD